MFMPSVEKHPEGDFFLNFGLTNEERAVNNYSYKRNIAFCVSIKIYLRLILIIIVVSLVARKKNEMNIFVLEMPLSRFNIKLPSTKL